MFHTDLGSGPNPQRTSATSTDAAVRPGPLPPDSLLWRYAGDSRIGLMGGCIGLLQLMHPAIGAGVMEHSDFFQDPMDRVIRSLPAILGAVYDGPDAVATGKWVRDQHKTITGTDAQGRKYHALDPETYWWAHATFQYMAEQVVDRYSNHRLSVAEREQLYAEGKVWYANYGVSARPVPATRADFQANWDQMCNEVLEMNDAVAFVLHLLDKPVRLPLPRQLRFVNRITRLGPVAHTLAIPSRVAAIGGLPPALRRRLGLRFTKTDELELAALERFVRLNWRFVPPAVRWQPRALAAWQRVAADGWVPPGGLAERPARRIAPRSVGERGAQAA